MSILYNKQEALNMENKRSNYTTTKFNVFTDNEVEEELSKLIQQLEKENRMYQIPEELIQIGEEIVSIPKKIVGTKHVFLNLHNKDSGNILSESKRIQKIITDLCVLKKVYGVYVKERIGFVNFHYLEEGMKESDFSLALELKEVAEVLPIQTFFYKIESGKRSLEIDYEHLPKHLILLYGDYMTKGLFMDIQRALENVGKHILCFYKTLHV